MNRTTFRRRVICFWWGNVCVCVCACTPFISIYISYCILKRRLPDLYKYDFWKKPYFYQLTIIEMWCMMEDELDGTQTSSCYEVSHSHTFLHHKLWTEKLRWSNVRLQHSFVKKKPRSRVPLQRLSYEIGLRIHCCRYISFFMFIVFERFLVTFNTRWIES